MYYPLFYLSVEDGKIFAIMRISHTPQPAYGSGHNGLNHVIWGRVSSLNLVPGWSLQLHTMLSLTMVLSPSYNVHANISWENAKDNSYLLAENRKGTL